MNAIDAQGVAAAGGGSVVQLSGSGDSWTVVVADASGGQTLAVVSASANRVTSGPFPKASDPSIAAIVAASSIDAAEAAAVATSAVSGSVLAGEQLGGSASAPRWTVTVSAGGATRTVVVDAAAGTVVSTS